MRADPRDALALHRRISEAAPGASCVIHIHSRHLVTLTLQGVWTEDDILPPITPYFVMKIVHVPSVPYYRPGDPAVVDLVAARVAAATARGVPSRAVMLDRLGPRSGIARPAKPARPWMSWRNGPPLFGKRAPGTGAVARSRR